MEQQLNDLIQLMLSGSAVNELNARRRLDELKANLSDEEAVKLDEDFQARFVDALEDQTGKIDEDTQKVIKSTLAANMTLGALKAGAGIFQIIDANIRKKGLEPPKFPQLQPKNSRLSNRLADAQSRAEQGDPEIRAQFEKDMAHLDAIYDKRAQTTGNAGRYQSSVQANALQQSRQAGKFAADESQRRAGYRGELDSLIGMDINEDRYRQNERWRQFDVLNRRYEDSLNALQNQSNSGVQNLFAGLDDIAANVPSLPLLKGNEPTEGDVLGGLGDTISVNQQPDPMDLGTLTRLGSPSYRFHNPMEVVKFQELGGLEPTGLWGGEEDAFFDELTTYR